MKKRGAVRRRLRDYREPLWPAAGREGPSRGRIQRGLGTRGRRGRRGRRSGRRRRSRRLGSRRFPGSALHGLLRLLGLFSYFFFSGFLGRLLGGLFGLAR